VDDSAEDREIYRLYLLQDHDYSYTILEAALGHQGLELWRQHQPDAMLVDYALPDMNGLEVLAQLQFLTHHEYFPVIIMTGQGNEVVAVQAMKAGAQDYLVKEQITAQGLQLAVNGTISKVQLCTQLAQREDSLRQSEERLRLALIGANAGSWDLDIYTSKVICSPESFDLSGFEPANVSFKLEDVYNVLYEADRARVKSEVERIIAEKLPEFKSEFRIIHPKNGICWILSLGRLSLNEQGEPIRLSGINLNISDRKQAEQEREQLLFQEQAARVEAERANRVKDEFLAILSHELRAPLNPILGWSQLLQTGKFDQAETAHALATIERNARLQAKLIDEMLDIAKIMRGKLHMESTSVDLVFVIESALATIMSAAVAKSITIHPVLAQVGCVFGDSERLQQVVWNLLANAVKFTPTHGRVDIRLDRLGNQAQITVSDTGKGISHDFLPYIFETFRQEDASTTRKYGGLGLGMAIVRTLVEAHGGTIFAESKGEAQGAKFIVRLPLLELEQESKQPKSLIRQEPQLLGIRVLIIDDDLDQRELISILLTKYGAEVMCVASAAEALDYLQTFQLDVLVSDIGMPDMDGYTFLEQVRSLPIDKGGGIPAIALSGYVREVDVQRALNCGYQQHINKPVKIEQLILAVEALAKTHYP
jgi:signal transduction histidine kinase/DNA-binding response OmpR family regulator